MNVANTSDKSKVMKSQNSANSPQIEQASCSFYSVVHDKNMAVTNLPLLKPAANQQDQASVMGNRENNVQPDWIAEPDSDHQAEVNSEFQQLLALNQELSAANSNLYAQVEQLKDELVGAEKIAQWQKTRSSVTESMLTEQTQELSAAFEQIQSLSHQLEAALQTVQHQEIFLETCKSQLEISQQRLAQLERECSLLQNNYSEQSQQLLQSENTCRELRSRLMRQQRQTLQFKVALEKCLDTPVPNYDTLEDTSNPSQDITCGQTRFSRKARSLFPNAQPIRPWSAESDLSDHLNNSWIEPNLPYPSKASTSQDSSHRQTPAPSISIPAVDESINTSETVTSANSWNLDQHLESLIQMFFASQDTLGIKTDVTSTTIGEELQSYQTDEPIQDILISMGESEPQPQVESEVREEKLSIPETHPADQVSSSLTEEVSTFTIDQPLVTTSAEQQPNTVLSEDYWSPVSSTIAIQLPEKDPAPEHKSPSPLIYPQRPPKGRKSLASVELPNFRPLRGNHPGGNGEN